jgi:S-DNA-T family DNA segregation ATPase FtsK/SpoIIIE
MARRSAVAIAATNVHAGWTHPTVARLRGGVVAATGLALIAAFATYRATDPSLDAASGQRPHNILGGLGADAADLGLQTLGLTAWLLAGLMIAAGVIRLIARDPGKGKSRLRWRVFCGVIGALALAGVLAAPTPPANWPLAGGLGGVMGELILNRLAEWVAGAGLPGAEAIALALLTVLGFCGLALALGAHRWDASGLGALAFWRKEATAPAVPVRRTRAPIELPADEPEAEDDAPLALEVKTPRGPLRPSPREARESQGAFEFVKPGGFRLPELSMLAKPKPRAAAFDEEALRQNARVLESVLAEFGVRGQVDQIRPGPVVTLYELAPAPGVKSARVVALSDDIARSMSVAACRVAVVPGRNAIGIELPNAKRETVYLRDLLASTEYDKKSQILPLALGETIGGEPYVADLTKMPHLLIAGTTGSGKSVGVNAMILSILYRLPPDQCRFIMIDPKMLELSVYDGIPHLLAPVVTDPKKAVVALKWTVREMEDRYRRMSKIGVRNIAGYNERALEALARGEHFVRTVQTGFDEQNRPIYEEEKLRPEPMPFLVVVIDEMADLMLVAGKDIEGAVQRLAQMARAAGIHLVMATQRPSVDVITGTIKANFPTRISFQVTSKIDSRTILGEQGAEQLLGQGDLLYMAGGGRITRLHGPFVSDGEVEAVARFLRTQGEPQYLDDVTASPDADDDGGGDYGSGGSGDDLYDRAVAVVTRDRKASTSYIQRRLQIGYNRAASLMERMEDEGVVGPANHAGKRDILAGPPPG